MRKKRISVLALVIFIFNIILLAMPANLVFSDVNTSESFIYVKEGIKDMLIYEDKLVLIGQDGQARLINSNNETVLEGKNYSVISKNTIINDEGVIFNLETTKYESKYETNEYYNIYYYLEEQYDFDSIYFLSDKIALIKNENSIYNISYYSIKDKNIINTISDIEGNSIDFDKDGVLYINKGGELSKYENNEFIPFASIIDKYNVRLYDESKIVIFNDYEYSIKDSSKESIKSEENIEENIEENKVIDIQESSTEGVIIAQDEISNNTVDYLGAPEESGVSYQTHIEEIGWQQWKHNGELSGTEGEAKRLEAIRINISGLPEGAFISYRTHIQDIGWQEWKSNGQLSGTENRSKRLEAIEIKLENAPGYNVEYRVHIQDIGWQEWKSNGEMAGTSGKSKRLEAIEIKIVQTEESRGLTYSTLVKNEGWKNNCADNEVSGSNYNNSIKAIKLTLNNSQKVEIQYRAHVQNIGWQNWVANGQIAGTENTNNNIEALQIKLVNAPDDYHVQYRVKTKDYGWQVWKSDGEEAGTTGLSAEIVAIQVKIVQDIKQPHIYYQTHIQDIGWQSAKKDGEISGTEGRAKRLEALRIQLSDVPQGTNILYRTHIQDYGWQRWISNGEDSGTVGKGKRLEAVEIKLDNEIPGYKLYYRVHVQDYGWQEWKASGETAGTIGKGKRLEAIEIKLVKDKNKLIVVDAGHNYGGDDGAYAKHNGITYVERDLNMSVALKLKRALESKGFEVAMTREPDDRETIIIRESLKKRVRKANYLDADFFISIHQNSFTNTSANGVEVFYSSAVPLSGGELLRNGIEYNAVKSRAYSSTEKVTKSKAISNAIVNSITNNMNRVKRGVFDDDYFVVKNTYMPSVLLECGFITNPNEAAKLANDYSQKTMAELIADEINKEF